ncbi:MAG: hypothetical protein J5791_10185 [Fibrobacter sp.]|jgi:hypothetical protein|nr:hypothetical protein [Fibrobacter sp.]
MKKALYFVLGLSILSLLSGCDYAEIREVKNSSLPYCETYTIAAVMDSLMQKNSWSAHTDASGKTTISCEGMIINDNRLVPAEFRFSQANGGQPELLMFTLEQKAQPTLLANKFFARVCSDDYFRNFETKASKLLNKVIDKVNETLDK